jgi:CheY-like chemotaxis protein
MSPRGASAAAPPIARPVSRVKAGIGPIAPLVGALPSRPGRSSRTPAVPGLSKILILEDEPSDAAQMQLELRKAGLKFIAERVATRADVIEALETFAPDVVLADCHLPDYSGAEALAHERHVNPEIPVVIVTGKIGDEAILGVADVIEAMMSYRPYRPALGLDAALAEIEKGKGRLFDPAAVDCQRRAVSRRRFSLRLSQGAPHASDRCHASRYGDGFTARHRHSRCPADAQAPHQRSSGRRG